MSGEDVTEILITEILYPDGGAEGELFIALTIDGKYVFHRPGDGRSTRVFEQMTDLILHMTPEERLRFGISLDEGES